MNPLPLLLLSALLPVTAHAAIKARSLQQHEIATEKELLITAPEVVDASEASYPGAWSFGHLMDEAFGPEQSRKVVAAWLDAWAKGVKGPSQGTPDVPGRKKLEELIIAPWKERDGFKGAAGVAWLPDFSHAPFRLLAIVNRMDLSRPAVVTPPPGSPGYYTGTSLANAEAGEGRLIFAAVDSKGMPLEGGLTIIFEYGLDAPKHERVFDWAMAWHRLGSHKDFSTAYRADLVQLSRLFTDRRPKPETTPVERRAEVMERLVVEAASDSLQLLRVRVNDGACGTLREFREFKPSEGKLAAAPLAGTPDEEFFIKGSAANRWLARWLDEQRVAPASEQDNPRAAKTEIPPSFSLPSSFATEGKSRPVTALVASVPGNDAGFHWDGWGMQDTALRRAFSMQTCCGCHCGDTSTEFFHVAPRQAGEAAVLSKFLRTDGSRWRPHDPADRSGFLSAEMEDRKRLYTNLLNPNLSIREAKRLRGTREGRVH